ncbi:c-type cytochrome domain-containing protein [Sorangium sp. So ce367]|uniref:c-type cytochrome domain-containing protein n=1 Tax=Sorangium sp. So ce367 TaxID=3133305 RepID=UPI003F6363F3
MTYIAFLGGRTALAAAVMSGAAFIISCAGTLEDKDQYLAGGDGPGGGNGQGTGAATGGGGDPTTTTGGDAATTTGGDAATTGGDAATTSASSGGGAGCAEAQALVMARCATSGCHDAESKQAGLSLAAGWETTVAAQNASAPCGSGPLLVPGDPDASLMYLKVTDDPTCNNRMPLGPLLSADEIKCLYDYIAALSQ